MVLPSGFPQNLALDATSSIHAIEVNTKDKKIDLYFTDSNVFGRQTYDFLTEDGTNQENQVLKTRLANNSQWHCVQDFFHSDHCYYINLAAVTDIRVEATFKFFKVCIYSDASHHKYFLTFSKTFIPSQHVARVCHHLFEAATRYNHNSPKLITIGQNLVSRVVKPVKRKRD